MVEEYNQQQLLDIQERMDLLAAALVHIRDYHGRPSVMRKMAGRALDAFCFADDRALADRRAIAGSLAYEVALLRQRIDELERERDELAAGWAAFDRGE
jgi:hypothetical protein